MVNIVEPLFEFHYNVCNMYNNFGDLKHTILCFQYIISKHGQTQIKHRITQKIAIMKSAAFKNAKNNKK